MFREEKESLIIITLVFWGKQMFFMILWRSNWWKTFSEKYAKLIYGGFSWKKHEITASWKLQVTPTALSADILQTFFGKSYLFQTQNFFQTCHMKLRLPVILRLLIALQIYWNRTSAWVLSCKFAAYFQNTFSNTNTSGWLLLWYVIFLSW